MNARDGSSTLLTPNALGDLLPAAYSRECAGSVPRAKEAKIWRVPPLYVPVQFLDYILALLQGVGCMQSSPI